METKKCTKCSLIKQPTDFYKKVGGKDGLHSHCKECIKETIKKWGENNKEIIRFRNHRWYVEHKEYAKGRSKLWRTENKDKAKDSSRRWIDKNIERAKDSRRKRRIKLRNTHRGKLNNNIRSGIYLSISRGTKAGRRWEDLVGYTVDQLKKQLEKLFEPGMTWNNYGTYWHIDHKIPIAVFNFERPEDIDFRLCWSLKNLQPLEAKDNNRKRAKIEEPFQPSLHIAV